MKRGAAFPDPASLALGRDGRGMIHWARLAVTSAARSGKDRVMRFLLVLLGDVLLLTAIGLLAWAARRAWLKRRQARMCSRCQDLAALTADDTVCPSCGRSRQLSSLHELL
ncbi:hypothetical protein D3C86_1506150 [compost metagenome]